MGSGAKVTLVPFYQILQLLFTSPVGLPGCILAQNFALTVNSALKYEDKAFTQETPHRANHRILYRCLYQICPLRAKRSLLPSADFCNLSCMPVGIPRPLSLSVTLLFGCTMTSTKSQYRQVLIDGVVNYFPNQVV